MDSNLSSIEQKVITDTALSIDNIHYYESIIGRKLKEEELHLFGFLKNGGFLLNENEISIIHFLLKSGLIKRIKDIIDI